MGYRRGQAYSQDLRDRVLSASGSAAVVGARFGASRSYVIKARQRRDRQGDPCAGLQRSHTPAKLTGMIPPYVCMRRTRLMRRLQSWWNGLARNWVPSSIKAMWKRLKVLDLMLKKDTDRCRATAR